MGGCFPGGLEGKSVCLQCRRPGFNPWVGKIPWRRKWQPTPVLLPGKSHGRRTLVGYSPWGHKESDTTERWHTFPFFKKGISLWTYIYLWLIHADVWQKPTQYCKVIILQLKINFLKQNSLWFTGGSAFLFYAGLQLIGWGPATLGRAICFIQSTDLNINPIQKHSHRHIQRWCLTKCLDNPDLSQDDT